MDATQSGTYDEKLETWNNLLTQQYDLFQATIERNRYLEEKNDELERQVDVWTKAHKSELALKKDAERRIQELEKNERALIEDNPLVLCLVDGDGNIFSPELISAGHTGGSQAATLLNRGIMQHLKDKVEPSTKNPQIWLTVYCNLSGLRDAFVNHQHCTFEQYDAFVEGFNKAAPLFSIVDVGSSKEAADTKLKESLRVFTRFPQIIKVYFGGLHDNGYATTLSHLQTEGLSEKLIFLRGYSQIAFQLRGYEIPECTIPGVFMTQKMPVKLNSRRFATGSFQAQPSPSSQPQQNLPYPQFQPNPSFTPPQPSPFSQPQPNLPYIPFQSNPSFTPPQPSPPFSPPIPTASPFQPRSTPTSPAYITQVVPPLSPVKFFDPTIKPHQHKPAPCNFYYLATCKEGSRCRFAHYYTFTPEELDDFRSEAKKYPCPFLLRGQPCELGDNCCMGHVCPRGLNCHYLKQGKCKYNKSGMHIAIPKKNKGRKKFPDGVSETTLSESGFSQ